MHKASFISSMRFVSMNEQHTHYAFPITDSMHTREVFFCKAMNYHEWKPQLEDSLLNTPSSVWVL
jgi:hypothetical protein